MTHYSQIMRYLHFFGIINALQLTIMAQQIPSIVFSRFHSAIIPVFILVVHFLSSPIIQSGLNDYRGDINDRGRFCHV